MWILVLAHIINLVADTAVFNIFGGRAFSGFFFFFFLIGYSKE